MKPLVYVAGPYSADPVHGTRKAIEWGVKLTDTHLAAAIVPHLTMFADLTHPRPESFWYDWDNELLRRCDALFRFDPGTPSKGASEEWRLATQLRIPCWSERDYSGLLGWLAAWKIPAVPDIAGKDVSTNTWGEGFPKKVRVQDGW